VSDVTLGEKAKVKETVRLYSKVWQLPSYRQIVLRMVLLVLIGSLILTVVKGLLLDVFLSYLVILGAPVFIGSGLLYVIATEEGSPLDGRRTAGLVQFGLLFWIALSVIGGVVDAIVSSVGFEIKFSILGVSIAYLAFAFLVNGLSDHHPVRNTIAALMPPLLWIIVELLLAPMNAALPTLPALWYIPIISSLIIASLVVHYIYRVVSVPFERDLGINGPQLLRAFGHDYLANNPEPLESILTKIATIQDIPVEIIIFRDDEGPVACGVIQYVHPGPFRDIGSSGLPSVIIEHIQETHGIPAFVMHGSCTHQQNLTTKEDYPFVFAEIDRLIEETEVHELISGPHWSDGGKFKVWSLFVGNDVLTISTSAPEFTDDISLDVGYDVANMIRERLPQVGGVAVVDAHNCIDDSAVSVNQGDPDASEYVGTVSGAVFSTINSDRTKVQLGMHQIVPDDISQSEGMGPGGVISVALHLGEREMALISIDGNNMEPGFREQALGLLKAQGFDDAEIITTDTHVVNAISLSSRGYPPIGRNKPDETLEHIVAASVKARERIQPVKVGLGFGKANGLRTFGEKGFDILTQDVAEAAGIAKKVGIRAGGGSILLYILLAFLI
jgi:putative membrane protein